MSKTLKSRRDCRYCWGKRCKI